MGEKRSRLVLFLRLSMGELLILQGKCSPKRLKKGSLFRSFTSKMSTALASRIYRNGVQQSPPEADCLTPSSLQLHLFEVNGWE